MGQGFWGGFPPAAPAIPAAVVPEGGLLFWSPVAPAFSFVFAPYPPTPLPRRGRGRPKLFHARGFAPCIPATEPGRHLQNQPSGCPAGCCILPRLLCPSYQCFPAPYPPNPLPRRGRGRLLVYFAGGSAPGTPALNRLRHLFALPYLPPAGRVLYPAAPALPAVSMLSCPLSPRPPSPAGKGETKVISCKGLRPLHPQH